MNWEAISRLVRYPIDRAKRTRFGDLLDRSIRDFTGDDGSIYAAAITYYLLLSIFPLLVVIVAVVGLLAQGNPDFQEQVIDEIVRLLPSGTGVRDEVEQIVGGVAKPRSGLFGLVALIGALWTASGVFGALRRALNNALDVPMKRSFIRGRLHDLVSVLVVVILAIASTALTATLALIRDYINQWIAGRFSTIGWGLIFFFLPLVLSFVFFLLVYRLIPNHTLRMRELWVGALIAAVGFELVKALFTFYLTNFATYDEVYGALGGLVGVLVFVFIVANITIFGAEVASELAKDRNRGVGRGGGRLVADDARVADPRDDERFVTPEDRASLANIRSSSDTL